MTSVAAVQRTLFRLQCDPVFAATFFEGRSAPPGSGAAVEDPALDAAGREILRAADPVRIAADPGGRRKSQVLSNLAAEFEVAARVASEGPCGAAVVAAFFASRAFHETVVAGGSLALAFGRHLAEAAQAAGDRAVRAPLAVEAAMAAVRRLPAREPPPPADAYAFAPRARVVAAPAGATDATAEARGRLAAGGSDGLRALFEASDAAAPEESALVVAAPDGSPHRLPPVRVERLEGLTERLLLRVAAGPCDADARAAFAREHDVDVADVVAALDAFVDEGALIRG